MAVATLPHASRRVLGSLLVAIAIVGVVATAFLVGRSPHRSTSIKPATPAISVPPRIASGFTGTVNSSADDPDRAASNSAGAAGDSSCTTVVRHSRIC